MEPHQDSNKPKKITKRTPASCSNCRRRRTRCDRLWPCSECERRKSNCDYQGARAPVISAKRRFQNTEECERYIGQLEARIQALKSNPEGETESAESPSSAQIDWVNEDLADHLSRVTLGPRIRSSNPRALETHAQSLLANIHSQPGPAVFLPKPAFTMSLIPIGPPTPLSDLQANFPAQTELAKLAGYYLKTLNVFYPCINPNSWPETLRLCYQARDSQELSIEEIHRLAAVLIVAAMGLLCSPNVHQSEPRANLEDISKAHHWCNVALAALTRPDQGAILTQPSIWGLRGMALLGCVELSPEDLDNGVFFWKLCSTLAGSIGLFQEPPCRDVKEVDELEIESRRQLAWQIITMDMIGVYVAGGVRQPIDPAYYAVNLPGKVSCEVDPADGWPLDPVIAMQQGFALINQFKLAFMSLNERTTSYDELLKVERSLIELEDMLPDRLQIVISRDQKSVNPKLILDPYPTVLCFAIWHRLIALRVWLHRPFIFVKDAIPDAERLRHLRELARACRIHFLLYDCLPPNYMMHPVVMFMYIVNTSIAAALGLVMCPTVFDSEFFLPQVQKFLEFLKVCSQRSIASSLAGKAVMLLEKLMAQVEQFISSSQPASKQQSGVGSTAHSTFQTSDTDQLKHKLPRPVLESSSNINFPMVSSTSPRQICRPKESKQCQKIVPAGPLPTPPLILRDQLQPDSTLQTNTTGPETLPSPQTPIEWNLMSEFLFTFSSPPPLCPDTEPLILGQDLCTSLQQNLDPLFLDLHTFHSNF